MIVSSPQGPLTFRSQIPLFLLCKEDQRFRGVNEVKRYVLFFVRNRVSMFMAAAVCAIRTVATLVCTSTAFPPQSLHCASLSSMCMFPQFSQTRAVVASDLPRHASSSVAAAPHACKLVISMPPTEEENENT